jgi:hypothetical protein
VALGGDAQPERPAGEAVGRRVGVQDPRRARLDQDRRHREDVEDRLDVEYC